MARIIVPSARNRVIRGVRDSIASGSVIGRASSGDGPAELIPLSDLARSMVAANFVAAPSNLSAEMDVLFGSSEGSLIQRGPSVWQGLSPGSANQVLASGGASALNAWESLSALLDAVFGSTRGMILYRGASGWAVLAPMAGGFLKTNNNTGDPNWQTIFTGGPVLGDLAVFSGGPQNPTLTNGAFSGDVSVVNSAGSLITTLATVNSNTGTWGDSTHVPQFAVNGKGLITAVSSVAITTPPGAITLTDTHILVGNGSNAAADVAMSGDVTISDTGATTIGNTKVTLAKIQNAAASSKLLGSGSSGSGASYSELSVSSNLSISGTTVDISSTGVSASTYGSSSQIPVLGIDAKGRVTSATTSAVTGVVSGAGGLIGVQRFTSTGSFTYTPTSGTSYIIIELLGAGGGGSGVASATTGNVTMGSGGGAGGWLRAKITSNFSGATGSVGSHGSGGAAGNHTGAAGGDTTFTNTAGSPTTWTAHGGSASFNVGPTAPPYNVGHSAGGTTVNGDDNEPGGSAYAGVAVSLSIAFAGRGGDSHYGKGGTPGFLNSTNSFNNGANGAGKGSGGGGACCLGSGSAGSGGDGTDGLAIIWEYS